VKDGMGECGLGIAECELWEAEVRVILACVVRGVILRSAEESWLRYPERLPSFRVLSARPFGGPQGDGWRVRHA
jgi:hypothetical protein